MSVRLTQYSHGAGCGCKIAPDILAGILAGQVEAPAGGLWVGNHDRDDAAVLDLGDGRGLISTTDFFMPVVDDPYTFGRIAATNAISDVYAMGGTPTLAIAILGWPLDKLGPEVAAEVVRGGRKACADAGIPLAGGHSIDAPEPIFGLAVNGLVQHEHLKRNSGARPGDRVYLTKPLGVGVLTTAEKKGLLRPEWEGVAAQAMTTLNRVGTALGRLPGVTALTDVTGFGLLGHGLEMAQGSGAVLEISAPAVRLLAGARACLDAGAVPGGTRRNLRAYGDHVEVGDDATRDLFADPQTSGGLLVACDPAEIASLEAVFRAHGLVDFLQPIGAFLAGTPRVSVVGSVGV